MRRQRRQRRLSPLRLGITPACPRPSSAAFSWSTQHLARMLVPVLNHATARAVAGKHGTRQAMVPENTCDDSGVFSGEARHCASQPSTDRKIISLIHPRRALDSDMLPSLVIAPRLSPVVHFSKEDVVSVDFIFAPYGPCLNIQNVSKNEIFRYMRQSQCDPLSEQSQRLQDGPFTKTTWGTP